MAASPVRIAAVKAPREPAPFEIVCVAKRTYRIQRDRLSLADEQEPIVTEAVFEHDPWGRVRTLIDDSDVLSIKPATDVVVQGHAHAQKPVTELPFGVAVGKSARVLRARGERRAEVSESGQVRFTPAEPFQRVALSSENAFGGWDRYAQAIFDPPPEERARARKDALEEPPDEGLFSYPRNPAGGCYYFDFERPRADGARVPPLDDPADPITPERFFVLGPEAWVEAPLPASLGWVAPAWYPRIVRLLGDVLPTMVSPLPIRETTFADGADLKKPNRSALALDFAEMAKGSPGSRARATPHPRALQGASPGLAVERLRGDELVLLQNLHPAVADLRFSLPGEVPRMLVRLPDLTRVFEPAPALQTVRLSPDEDRVSLTWCGTIAVAYPPDDTFLAKVEAGVTFRPR